MDMDFATSCPLVRPVLPHIRLLFVRSRFRSTLPSDGPSRFRPCASLVLHLHQVAQGTFTPRLLDMPSTQAARARRFAAEMALQSYALRAAAEGAALAYAESYQRDLESLRSAHACIRRRQPPRRRGRDGRIPDRLTDRAGGAARLCLVSFSFPPSFIAGGARPRGDLSI